METLYIHKQTGNIQYMSEATWEVLGGEKSGWKIANKEELEKASAISNLEKPKETSEKVPNVAPKVEKIEKPKETATNKQAITAEEAGQ